jgi:hypothetical protein
MRIARLGKFCLPYFYLLAVLSVLFLLFFCPSWLAQVQEKQGSAVCPQAPPGSGMANNRRNGAVILAAIEAECRESSAALRTKLKHCQANN